MFLSERTLVYWVSSPVFCCYGAVSSLEQRILAFVHLFTFFLLFIIFTHLVFDPVLHIHGKIASLLDFLWCVKHADVPAQPSVTPEIRV